MKSSIFPQLKAYAAGQPALFSRKASMIARKFSRTAVAVATAASLLVGTVPHALAVATQVQSIQSLTWPDARVTPGGEVKVKPEGEFASSVRFSGDRDYLGFSFTTEPRTGEVTIRVADNVAPGESTMFVIKVRDGVHTVEREVRVDVVNQPGKMAQNYPAEYFGVFTSLDRPVVAPLQGEVPAGTTFSVTAPEHYAVEVDNKGALTVTQTDVLRFRSNTAASVTVHYPDGSEETLAVPLMTTDLEEGSHSEGDRPDLYEFLEDPDKYLIRPEWGQTVMPGDESRSTRFENSGLDAKSFKFREDLAPSLTKRFDVDVDEHTGEVTLTPKRPIRTAGSRFFVPVEVTYSNQRVGLGSAVFEIGQPGLWASERVRLEYQTVEAPTPGPFTSVLKGDFPEGTRFEHYGEVLPGWTVNVARATGDITVNPPKNTKPNISFEMTVVAQFPDGSMTYLSAPFRLVSPENPQSRTANVTYPDFELHPGETVTYEPDGLPADSIVTIKHTNYAEQRGIDVSVDSRTGAVTISARPDASTSSNTRQVILNVLFEDGSETVFGANYKVTDPDPAPAPGPEPTPKPETTPEPERTPSPEPTATPTPEVEPTNPPQEDGSSTGGIIAIVLGVLAALGGLTFAAKPQLEQMGLWPR